MSTEAMTLQIWRELLCLERAVWHAINELYMIFASGSLKRDRRVTRVEDTRATIRELLEAIPSQEAAQIDDAITDYIDALSEGQAYKSGHLERLLADGRRQRIAHLETIPSSIGKAKGLLLAYTYIPLQDVDQEYDAFSLFPGEIGPGIVGKIVARWKEDLRRSLSMQEEPIPVFRINDTTPTSDEPVEYRPNLEPRTYLFWNSADFKETLDAISRYRFMEVFHIGEFPETRAEIEDLFASSLTEYVPAALMLGDWEWQATAFEAWLASRSPSLCAAIRPSVELCLRRIALHQESAGPWPARRSHSLPEPSTYATALACVVLLRLARNERQLEGARRGVRWLAKQQLSDGSWSEWPVADPVPTHNQDEPGDLLITLLACEAIRESRLDGLEHSLRLGEDWIMRQQRRDGSWPDNGFPEPFITVLVVEYFCRSAVAYGPPSNYEALASAFITRSIELAREENHDSRRIAIVLAFHGTEMLLYALLSHPSVGKSVFEASNRTIGFRKALSALQDHLVQTQAVANQLHYRNDLDRLAHLRDEVVHKVAGVTELDATSLTGATIAFAQEYSQQVLGRQIP